MNDQGHLVVDFRNPDGSRSFCGNGTRTALAWAHGAGLLSAQDTSVAIEAVDGLHQGFVRADGTPGNTLLVDVATRFGAAGQPASSSAFVDTGSPHHVMWLDSAQPLSTSTWNPQPCLCATTKNAPEVQRERRRLRDGASAHPHLRAGWKARRCRAAPGWWLLP